MRKWLNISVILILLMPCISRAQFDSISNYDFWTDLSDVEFLNDSVGFVVGSVGLTARAIILKTIDGGQNWDTVFGPNKKGSFKNISFATDSVGFVCGSVEIALPEPVGIYRTFDQGETWEYCGDSVTFGVTFDVVEFNSNGVGIASGTTGVGTFISYNWGNDWTDISMTGPVIAGGVFAFNQGQFIDDTTFYSCALGGLLTGNAYTYNWDAHITDPYLMLDLNFISDQQGYFGGYVDDVTFPYGTFGATSNGGLTWDYQTFQVDTLYHINTIEVLQDSILFLCGQLKQVLKSTDSGANWARIPRTNNWPVLPNFSAMSCPSDSVCYAVGPSGLIFKLTNGQDYVSSVSEITAKLDFKLYPSPTSDLIHLELENSQGSLYNVSVSDIQGRVILNEEFYSS
ncbi:MAG: photosystem II stability/assembly factor-like uncharacterized protein, partial [Parvicellaceae bacterium]